MHILHIVFARAKSHQSCAGDGALRHYSNTKQSLPHIGQHYDPNMSDVIFLAPGNPSPRYESRSRLGEAMRVKLRKS
jgi:hypothetical protein